MFKDKNKLLSPNGLWQSKNRAAIFYLNLTDPPQLNTDLHLEKQKALQLRRHLMNRMGGLEGQEPRGSAVTTPHRADVEVFARHLGRERGRRRASDLHDKQRHPLCGGRTGSCKAGVRHSQQGCRRHHHTYCTRISATRDPRVLLGGGWVDTSSCSLNCGRLKRNKVVCTAEGLLEGTFRRATSLHPLNNRAVEFLKNLISSVHIGPG